MIILLIFAFISGLFTILAPCIWPLLPIVLSTSASHPSRWRPFGITLGIVSSFAIFTLSISALVRLLHIDANWFRYVAVAVLVFFGLSLLAPKLNAWVESKISRVVGFWGRRDPNLGDGFAAGVVTGVSLGIVWSPCAGPILATIATLAASERLSGQVVLVTLFYIIGIAIPLFGFAYGGQRLVVNWRVLSRYNRQMQVFFGCTTIITAMLIATNYDKAIEANLLNYFPQYADALNDFENATPVQQELGKLKGHASSAVIDSDVFNVQTLDQAPDFSGINHWINSKPLTMSQLKGKVVLVDFWTYTCINCIRTLPYVERWYNTYKDQGLMVIGVHTPEFAFEHDTGNVERAMKQFGVTYPVAQDNDYRTWNAFNNSYWPAEYLIDATGRIRREEFGEGNYDKMEQAIQLLLKENGQNVTAKVGSKDTTTPTEQTSPETYFGSDRMQYYVRGSLGNGEYKLLLDQSIGLNTYSLGGEWQIESQQAVAVRQASMNYKFVGDHLYAVLRPGTAKNGTISIKLDGKTIPNSLAGADVKNGQATVDSDRLYDLVNLHGQGGEHIIQIDFAGGIELFTLTFG